MFCAVFIIRQINVDCVHFLRSADLIMNKNKRIGKVTTLNISLRVFNRNMFIH